MQTKSSFKTSLTLLLLLTSSSPTTATSVALHPSPSNAASIQARFLPLFDVVEQYYTYIKENKEREKVNERNMLFAIQTKNNKMQERLIDAKKCQEEFAEKCYKDTLDLVLGKMTIDEYLSEYLHFRYNYLQNRTEKVESYWSEMDNLDQNCFFVPTDKDLFELISTIPDYGKSKQHNEFVRKDNIRHYQLLNELIRLAYRACNLEELTKKTLTQLRASKQLHNILIDDKSDLGHPDQAGGYGGIRPMLNQLSTAYKGVANKQQLAVQEIAHALRKQQEKLNDGQKGLVKIMELVINQLLLTKKLGTKIGALTPLISYFFRAYKQLKSDTTLFEDDMPNNQTGKAVDSIGRDIDVNIYEGHLTERKRVLYYQGLGQSHTSNSASTSMFMSDYAYDQACETNWNNGNKVDFPIKIFDKSHSEHNANRYSCPLPNPDFLVKKQEVKSKKRPSNTICGLPCFSSCCRYAPPSPKEKFCIEMPNDSQHKPSAKSQPAVQAAPTWEDNALSELERNSITKLMTHKMPSSSSHVLARWIRKYRKGLMAQVEKSTKVLSPRHQRKADEVFDNKLCCNVSYGEIKAIWKNKGGDIREGNHPALLDKRGKVVIRLWAHGKNQTYGMDTIHHIRSAFIAFGIESKLSC